MLREVAASFGWQLRDSALPSIGSLAENARILVDWLTARADEPLVLVSLSKGEPT